MTIKQAQKIAKKWQDDYLDNRRNYNNKKYHCVNVKRYNDYVDTEALFKKYYKDKKHAQPIKEVLSNIDGLYEMFLNDGWELINDFVNGYTEQEFHCVGNIYQMGRGGGWACFETSADSYANDIGAALNIYEQTEMTKDEICYYAEGIDQAMQEIDILKNEIQAINANMDFERWVKGYLNHNILQVEYEKENDKRFLFTVISDKMTDIELLLKQYSTDKTYNTAIKRNIKSIRAIIKKFLTGSQQ